MQPHLRRLSHHLFRPRHQLYTQLQLAARLEGCRVILAALLTRLLWRKRKSPDRVKDTLDGESAMQGKDVDGAGSPFKAENGKLEQQLTRFDLPHRAAHVSA